MTAKDQGVFIFDCGFLTFLQQTSKETSIFFLSAVFLNLVFFLPNILNMSCK